jgi:uncharacterized cupredoxin-like copper-binding protein
VDATAQDRRVTRRRGGHSLVIVASVAVTVAICATVVLVVSGPSNADGGAAVLGPEPVTVRLDVEHSRFTPSRIEVRPHTTVRFVVVNHDPIGHELIVGDASVHARHADGTEAHHAARAGEVSVAPNARASTTFTFHGAGSVLYACHLPRHFEYGMKGTVLVARVSNDDG